MRSPSPSFDDIYGGDFIKPDMLEHGKRYVMTVSKVEFDTFVSRQSKKEEAQLVLHFRGAKRKLGLSAVNAHRMVAMYGKNWENDWVGQKVVLHIGELVDAFGKTHTPVRILPFDTANLPKPKDNPPSPEQIMDSRAEESAPEPSSEPEPPRSVAQGVHQAQHGTPPADPFADIGKSPAPDSGFDDFNDDLTF